MAIACHHLKKVYESGEGIFDLSFNVGAGRIHGFLGPNGSGKTTTLKIMAQLICPTEGQCLLANSSVGYLPEKAPLYLSMRVREYLELVFDLYSTRPSQRQSMVDSTIEQCGLVKVQKMFMAHLSKGFRQRVGVAQALVHGPSILILDEPFVGLDLESRAYIRELFLNLKRRGHSLIFSTHQLSEVEKICDELTIIKEGRLIYTGLMEEFLSQGKSPLFPFSQKNNFEEKLMRELRP